MLLKPGYKFGILLIALTIGTSYLQGANCIAIKAIAPEKYIKSRALDVDVKVQIYRILKGNYHGGKTADPSMDEIFFEEVIENLAIHLQKQNFYPQDGLVFFIV
tara:strand:+ start:4365 stop:4676 length:312 start_codon:yes stop_codon:yes gene_type:complete